MNIYDFDGTLYHGDSTRDFLIYLYIHHPSCLKKLPSQIMGIFRYATHKASLTEMKESVYSCFAAVRDISRDVDKFWMTHAKRLSRWYSKEHKDNDIILSASPEFLIRPAADLLCIKTVIASRVSPETGKYNGKNCKGNEKIKRYHELFGDKPIEKFYSDSHADDPLAALAKEAFMVKGEGITRWPEISKK